MRVFDPKAAEYAFGILHWLGNRKKLSILEFSKHGNLLQSRRDDMFIELCSTHLFSPVGTICVPNDIFSTYRPYGTKRAFISFFYKHIVPTGLKKLLKYLFIVNSENMFTFQ